MEEMARNEGLDRISDLPQPILHYILSKVSEVKPKYAARTSVLSKAWKSVYDSFPEVVLNKLNMVENKVAKRIELGKFNVEEMEKYTTNLEQFNTRYSICPQGIQCDFYRRRALFQMITRQEFMFLSDNRFKRISDMLVRPQVFRIKINMFDDDLASLIDNWIDLVARRNINKEVKVSVDPNLYMDPKPSYHLPRSILDAKSLTVLKLRGCKLDSPFSSSSTVKIPSLKELYLRSIHLNDQILGNLMSTYPCLQIFVLENISGLTNFSIFGLEELKFVKLSIDQWEKKPGDFVITKAPCLEAMYLSTSYLSNINVGTCRNIKKFSIYSCRSLTDQLLQEIMISNPLLETLELDYCHELESVTISSHKLKKIVLFYCPRLVDVKIEAPNLSYFRFCTKEETTPSISLININYVSQLQVRFSFHVGRNFGARWVHNFRQCISKFGQIEHLSLSFDDQGTFSFDQEAEPEPEPEPCNNPPSDVSFLMIQSHGTGPVAFADVLFWTCRPNTIYLPKFKHHFLDFVKRVLEKVENRQDLEYCNIRTNSIRHWEEEEEDIQIEYEKSRLNELLDTMANHFCKDVYIDFKWKSDHQSASAPC